MSLDNTEHKPIRLMVEDLQWLYRPKKCELRLFNHYTNQSHDAVPVLVEHDKERLSCLFQEQRDVLMNKYGDDRDVYATAIDCSCETQALATTRAVGRKSPVVNMPQFAATFIVDEVEVRLYGSPDFLVYDKEVDGYILQVCTLDRDPDKDCVEARELRLYDRLFSKMFGKAPARLEIVSPGGKITLVNSSGSSQPFRSRQPQSTSAANTTEKMVSGKRNALGLGDATWMVRKLLEVKAAADADQPMYSSVSKSKCSDCPFTTACYEKAKQTKDIAIVPNLQPSLVEELRSDKYSVATIPQLLELGVDTLVQAEAWSPETNARGPIGTDRANLIMRAAHALADNRTIVSKTPTLPQATHYILFDLEGVPANREPSLDGDRIYLWGMLLMQADETESKRDRFFPVLADFEEDSDFRCWRQFLSTVKALLDEHNPVFLHWYEYEKNQIETYIARYKDRMTEEEHATAQRVLVNLVDLLPITRESVALPISSYGLKAIEAYLGFSRSQDDFGGKWSICQYENARDASKSEERQELMQEILTYNYEDLASTWLIFRWLQTLRAK